MLYFGMLFVTLTMVFLMTMVGLRISDLLPARLRPVGRFYFSPLFGLAVFILIATLHGWLAPFHKGTPLLEALLLVLVAFSLEKKKKNLPFYFLFLFLFSILASTTVLFTILRFETYNSFNDTFTYLVHGQWLQEHPFSERVISSGFYPALTQISLYQNAGHRMGASFLLGWVQAAFGLTWSYYAYPAAILLPFIAGSLAVGGAIKLIVHRQRSISILIACAVAILPNGFTFGAVYGFYPQTFGLAFAVGGVILIGGLISQSLRQHQTNKLVINTIPISLIFSALALAYNDLLPFIGAATFAFIFVFIAFRFSEIKKVLLPLLILIVQVAVVINFEFIRIVRNFIRTLLGVAAGSHAIGWPVRWAPWEFIAHSFGFKSPIERVWLFRYEIFTMVVFAVVFSSLLYFLYLQFQKKLSIYLYLNSFVILVFIAGFFYFRYFVKPPHPAETGNTFLQFKLAKWAAPFCFIWLGTAFAYFSDRFRKLSKALTSFLIISILLSTVENYKVAEHITNNFLDETGYRHSAFSSLLHLRELTEGIDKNEVIYVNLGAIHHKLHQMVAYTLHDRKLAADYSDDGYIFGHLPPDQRSMPVEMADWIIEYIQPNQEKLMNLPRAGHLILKKRSDFLINFISTKEGYDREESGTDWWHWTSESLEFKYRILGDLKKVKLSFIYMPATENRDLNIIITSKNETKFAFKMKAGWNEFITPPINIEGSDFNVKFTSSEKPVRVSDQDPRMMSFLIKNLKVIGSE